MAADSGMLPQRGVVLSSSAHLQRTADINEDMASEQAYLTRLYDRLDLLREQADDRLRAILLEAGGTPQGRSQREATRSHYAEQLAQMNSVENGLCFGRLDFAADNPRYIGRIGLSAEDRDSDPLLIDWRAPAPPAVFLPTPRAPAGGRPPPPPRPPGPQLAPHDG